MNLKDFLANREKPPELYWALVLEPGWVQAGIWFIGSDGLGAGKAEVMSISPGAAWETEEELVGAADAALSSSVQKLPEETGEPTKTVFGVPAAWVKNGEIEEDYLAKIKKICTELSLSPVGFVVIPEAIAHLYKSEEGAPTSAVIIGLGRDALEITVFKLGNLIGTTSVSRSVSLIEDVTEGLARFEGAAPLPSRIILFDGKEGQLEEARDTLMGASWEEDLPAGRQGKVKFLHTPKVEFLVTDKKVIATALAGAAEMGNVTGILAKEEEEHIPEEVQNVALPEEEIDAGDLGFAVGEDVSVRGSVPTPEPSYEKPQAPFVNKPPRINQFNFVKNAGISLLDKTKNIFGKLPMPKKPPLIWPVAFIILLIAGALFWWFYPKATVTIFVSPKSFSQDQNISFSTDGTSDTAAGIVPGAAITSSVSGEKTKGTTGTKLVGDKAKGSVLVSNGNPNPINLAAGTLLTSSSGLKFVTNAEASISGQILPGQPGTSTLEIAAADIGSQYNLAKGEIFSVGNFSKSLVAATSQGDFSGGSSQQISAVAKSDQTTLETDLKNELTEQAASDLSGKINDSQIFVSEAAENEITSANFDHKIGDEADNLKLSLGLKVTGVAADKEKLLEYAKALLKDKTPPGFVLRDSQIGFKFTFVEHKDGLYSYKVTINANFLPQINSDELIGKVLGKTLAAAESYLKSTPGYVHAQIKVNPALGFLTTLPHVRKNITIDVVAEQ